VGGGLLAQEAITFAMSAAAKTQPANDRFSWRTFAKTPRQVSADSVAKVFLRH
jgi:hypothetical protein